MIKNNDILQEVINIVSEHFKIGKDLLSPNTDFVKDLSADSVDMVTLLFLFEDRFGVVLGYNKGLASISDIVCIIESRLNDK